MEFSDRTKDELIDLGYPRYTVDDFHETVSNIYFKLLFSYLSPSLPLTFDCCSMLADNCDLV